MSIAATPNNFYVTQANRQVYLQWDIEAGATSYSIQRSTDGVNYTVIATSNNNNYLDTSVVTGTQYYFQVASVNGSGNSAYTAPQSVVPTPAGEMSLGQIRLSAQQRADRVNSQFVTLPEWNSYINQAMFELYDLLITSYEDYFVASPAAFQVNGSTYLYPLPDGATSFTDLNGNAYVAPPFYKLLGVDLALNTAQNAWVTVDKFNFIDRNRFIYPNTSSTIYGVFNLQYRMLGSNVEFIPTPSGGQSLRYWYIPRLTELLKDNDITTAGISGWIEYVIVRAAIYALVKEESDTASLERQLVYLKQRIEESAVNRDAGRPDRISDVRGNGWWGAGSGGYGGSGPVGGWALLAPVLFQNYSTNHSLTNTIHFAKPSLAYIAASIGSAYLLSLLSRNLSGFVNFTFARNFIARSLSTFHNHVLNVISLSSKKQVIGSHTASVVTPVANAETSSNWAVGKLIRQSVRSNLSTLTNIKQSVASRIMSLFNLTSPLPASVTFLHSSPKLRHHTNQCTTKLEGRQ